MYPQLSKDINAYHIYTLRNARGYILASSNNWCELCGIMAWYSAHALANCNVHNALNGTIEAASVYAVKVTPPYASLYASVL